MALPYRTTGSLKPTFVSARLVGLAVNLVYAFALVGLISKQPEPSFARLRYRLGGDRPSQTTRLPLSLSPGLLRRPFVRLSPANVELCGLKGLNFRPFRTGSPDHPKSTNRVFST